MISDSGPLLNYPVKYLKQMLKMIVNSQVGNLFDESLELDQFTDTYNLLSLLS